MTRPTFKKLSLVLLAVVLSATLWLSTTYATLAPGTPPPSGGYDAGSNSILDPGCGPTDTDCFVKEFQGWKLTGNAGTTVGTDFLGTTDAENFMIKTNGNQIALFGQNGNVAIGSGNTGFGVPAPVASGIHSFATGLGATASGPFSTSLGLLGIASGANSMTWGTIDEFTSVPNEASGDASTAFGEHTNASGPNSTTWGVRTLASNYASTAFGISTIASGYNTTAFGSNNFARSENETSFGQWGTDYVPAVNVTDRLVSVGNGADDISRSDAFTILKNGKVAIGIDGFESTSSSALLQVGDNTWTGDMARFQNSAGTCTITNPAGWTCSSDERLKTDISSLSNYGLSSVLALRPVTFNWAHGENPTPTIGFIAQEVQNVIPSIVTVDRETGLLSLSTTQITPILVKAIQDINLKVTDFSTTNTDPTGLVNIIKSWLGNRTNGITEIFAGTLRAKDQLCIDDVCVTKDQLRTLLQNNNVPSTPMPVITPPADPVIEPGDNVDVPPTDTVPTNDPEPADPGTPTDTLPSVPAE